jgi:hypothetical protein
MPSDRSPARTFRDLRVWQKAHEFVLAVYRYSDSFPEREKFGLAHQLRRAAVSIPANIADFSESQFRTLKYRPEFPDRFGCIQDSRAFCQSFFRWYNDEHRHSGVGLLTPATVHYGQAENALRQRQDVLDVAYQRQKSW